MITYEDFQKLDLRIANIISAEKVEGADKLLKLQVDLGEEKRQLVAGIALQYKPDALVGKQVVVVTNLEPRVLRGVESQGMALAADANGPVLLKPGKKVPAGTKVK